MIAGRTGSGKSQEAAWQLSQRALDEKPWIIVDFKGGDLMAGVPVTAIWDTSPAAFTSTFVVLPALSVRFPAIVRAWPGEKAPMVPPLFTVTGLVMVPIPFNIAPLPTVTALVAVSAPVFVSARTPPFTVVVPV